MDPVTIDPVNMDAVNLVPVNREPAAAEARISSAPVHPEPVHPEPVQPVHPEPAQPQPKPASAKAAHASAARAVAVHASTRTAPTNVVTTRTAPTPAMANLVAPFTAVTRLPRWMARALVILFLVVHALTAFTSEELSPSGLLLTAIAFVSISVAAVCLGLSGPDRLPRARTCSILGLSAITAVTMSFQVSPLAPGPFAHWHLGAITLLLVVLTVSGRIATAWVAYGGLVAIAIVWAISYGLTVGDGVGLVVRHAATLLAATLFAVGLRRSSATLKVLRREGKERAVADATAVAAIEEREAHLARVNGLARPTLDLLARSHELDDEMRAECLLVEATLRDAMRGRALFVGPVIRAARAARLRGVDVTLLDDSGDHPPVELAAVASAVAGELSILDSGRLTARVLPADRPVIATIVVEADEHRILMITPSGEVSDG